MSYNICKSVSIKNGTITLSVACNNVYPHTYETWYYNEGCKLEDCKFFFFLDVLNGNIQFRQLNKSTLPYEHALMRVKEWFSDNVQSEYEYYKKAHNGISDNEVKELYKEPYRVWNEALSEKDNICVLRYTGYLRKGGNILVKAPNYGKYGFSGFGFTDNIEKAKISRKKAELFVHHYDNGNYECRIVLGHKVYIDEVPNC